MSFEPEKFFIGLVDFFAIFLPGALLAYLLKDAAAARVCGPQNCLPTGTEGVAVFIFCAYVLGHFIFLIGSWVMDNLVYDPLRQATEFGQIERLASGKLPSSPVARWLAGLLFRKNPDRAVERVAKIKNHYLSRLKASSAINAFQWSKVRMMIEHPKAIVSVERFEADSKFFRSFTVVLIVLIFWGSFSGRLAMALVVGVPLLIFAFLRYVEQRLKATNQAYKYILTLESQSEDGYRPLPHAGAEIPRAGGVVFKSVSSGVEYLLVQARRSPHEWVLPKGHMETGEPMRETAVREVHEESGVWARIVGDLPDLVCAVNGEAVRVQFYLMEGFQEDEPTDQGRGRDWMPLAQALERARYPESRTLLGQAEEKRIALKI